VIVKKFKYSKSDVEITTREAIVLHENPDSSYIDAVDLHHLDEKEKEDFLKIYSEYEEKMKPFIKKAFRRFTKTKIEYLKE